ncbi:unnamed protein product, partial [Rotaria magnacalcarata]
MTFTNTSLQNEIDDLSQRRNLLKQKWIDRQRNVSDLLASTVVACRTSANDIHFIEQQKQEVLSSDRISDFEFESSLVDYLSKHAPILVSSLAQ